MLENVSQELESLETLAGIQSFFLVVNPHDPDDQGFLGGTIVGREFWRGHRSCGAPGAEAFKTHCMRVTTRHPNTLSGYTIPPTVQNTTSPKTSSAREVKNELYAGLRHALRLAPPKLGDIPRTYDLYLRTVSGVRKAEMKWTNHAKLAVYKVHINGWPESVPTQNPSVLSATQNKLLLELLREGKLYFSRLEDASTPETNAKADEGSSERDGEDAIFEDWLSEGTDAAGYQANSGRVLTVRERPRRHTRDSCPFEAAG